MKFLHLHQPDVTLTSWLTPSGSRPGSGFCLSTGLSRRFTKCSLGALGAPETLPVGSSSYHDFMITPQCYLSSAFSTVMSVQCGFLEAADVSALVANDCILNISAFSFLIRLICIGLTQINISSQDFSRIFKNAKGS